MLSKTATREELFFLTFTRVSDIVRKIAEEALKDSGVTIAEFTLLRIVENHPGITAGELRERMYATAPSIAQFVKTLERRGMIRRSADPEDARRMPLRIERQGRIALQRAKKGVARVIRRVRAPDSLLDSISHDLSILLSSLPAYGAA